MANTRTYLDLITSAWRQKPKFTAMIEADTKPSVEVQNLCLQMIPLFDLDIAEGDQLDIIGEWVGISRNIAIPIPPTDITFSWDGTDANGWDYGTWESPQNESNITTLPDEQYRTVIRAKIAANKWDGSIQNAYEVWDSVFTQFQVLIKDNQDMSYELGFYGGIVDSLTLALILEGYIPLKPAGVRLAGVFTPANDGPLFAWDTESEFLAGWDEGSWVNEVSI